MSVLPDPVPPPGRPAPSPGRPSVLETLTGLATELLGAPSAQVSLVGEEQTVVVGAGEAEGTAGSTWPLSVTLCSIAAASGEPLVVPDTRRDARVAARPAVIEGVVGSYLGVPLAHGDGTVFGALCVFGPVPRAWSDTEVATLRRLAGAVTAELELDALTAQFEREQVRWELALDAAGVGSFDWDLVSGALHWDGRMQALFGYDPDQDGTPDIDTALDHIDVADRADVDTAIGGAVASCGSYRSDYRIHSADGVTRWIAARGRAVPGPDGAAVRLLGTAQDVTELRTARDEAARLVDRMLTGFIAMDREWRVTYLNAAGAAVVGYSAEELVGRVLWDAFPGLSDLSFGAEYRRAVATGRTAEFEAFYPHLGSWFDVRAVPSPAGLDLYFTDVSERRAAHEASLATARNLTLLAKSGEVLVGGDIEPAIAELAAALVPALADWTIVTVRDGEGRFHGLGRAHDDPAMLPFLDSFVDQLLDSITDEAALSIVTRTGEPLMVEDYAATMVDRTVSEGPARDLLRMLDPDTILTVPVTGRSGPIGAISLVRVPGRKPLTEEEVATAVEIGRRAGVALENAQLARAQRRLSETLQNSLLSTPPRLPGLDIAVRYRPAASDAAVGGDWYDSFVVRDGATHLVVGDVTGHDREAAATMGQVRALLRGTAYAVAGPPARVLSALDEAMAGLDVGTLATCVLARVEPPAPGGDAGPMVLRWSNAGHPAPVLVAPGEHPVVLRRDAELLLGLDPATARSDHAVDLPPGSVVVLYTDGLVERRGEDLDQGTRRLVEVLDRLRDRPLGELCDALLDQLVPDAEDDVALLAVRVEP